MNNQGKLTVALSERDKMALIIVVIAAIIFCSYYFGYRNINTMTIEMKEETSVLTRKYQALYPLYQEKDDYIEETKSRNEEYDKKLAQFVNGTTQESLIMTAKSIEENTNVWFSSVTLSEITPVYTFGQITSTNPANIGSAVYSTDMVGHKSTMTLSYQVTYDDCKKMLSYLNENDDHKFSIESIGMSYDEGEDKLNGSITLAMYDITGSARPYEGIDVYNVPVGTSNLFKSRLGSSNVTSSILTNYDIYMSIAAFEKGKENVKMGVNRDALAQTVIGAEGNSLHTATLTLTGKNGNYKVSYKIGDQTYPVENFYEGADFKCGDTLDLLVFSSSRTGAEDKSSVKLNITNNTDKILNLYVFGDDGTSPRFALGTTTGSVNVEE